MPAATVAASPTTVAAAPTATHGASAAPGWPETGISMVALHPRRAALPNAAESATVFARCARGNLPVAHSRGSGLRAGASNLRLSG
jgi:hypothetical protein